MGFVRLKTNLGLTGLGESHTEKIQKKRSKSSSLLSVILHRLMWKRFVSGEWQGQNRGTRISRAFCALKVAMWDLIGKALGVPIYNLFGGKFRDSVPVYANINRATQNRTPMGFAANAREAVRGEIPLLKPRPLTVSRN